MTISVLDNPVLHNDWGCSTSMVDLYGYANPEQKPMAELWMGAHPKAPSTIFGNAEQVTIDLNRYIEDSPSLVLGEVCASKFANRLPFLFKVLSADSPLSIQSHPNKQQAEEGWQRENQAGIPLNAPHRNYKDDNHKPELVYAITEFHALNGFRDYQQTIALFNEIKGEDLSPIIELLIQSPDSEGLNRFYHSLMTHPSPEKLVHEALTAVRELVNQHPADYTHQSIWNLALQLNEKYPGDIGVLSPFLINYVILQPGEAMFLTAGTLHAYLKGTALELMANSDNVLRGGLTPKHIDIPELFSTTVFEPKAFNNLKLSPQSVDQNEEVFLTSADDFQFSVIALTEQPYSVHIKTAEILFVLEGSVTISNELGEVHTLTKGQSAFISAQCLVYQLSGAGKLARATTPI